MKLSSKTYFSPKNIGIYGEKVVTCQLVSKGHYILAQNLRLRCGEIDILTLKNKDIFIIEVKAVLQKDIYNKFCREYSEYFDYFRPEDNLSRTKIRKLKLLREELLYLLNSGGKSVLKRLGLVDLVDLYNNKRGDIEVQIYGFAVDIYPDFNRGCVSRITLRHFPLY